MGKGKTLKEIKETNYLEGKPKIKSNILPLDNLLRGGFSYGEIVQLVGETKTGKTTLALQVAYGFCSQGKKVLFIDAKGDVRIELLQTTSLQLYLNKQFFYVRESIFTIVEECLEKFINEEQIDLIIIDSLPSLINERSFSLNGAKRIKSDNTNTAAGTKPLVFLINKLKKLSNEYRIHLLFVNEFRNKVDTFKGTVNKVFGPKCLEYESNSIIQLKRATSKNEFKEKFNPFEKAGVGISEELVPIKEMSLKPTKPEPFFFEFGTGYQDKYVTIYRLIKQKEISQNGKCYKFRGTEAEGIMNLMQALTDNNTMPTLINYVKQQSIQS